ncbi:MAG TPA: trypsin-like serine protease [Streptosporangiaceae bacterium]
MGIWARSAGGRAAAAAFALAIATTATAVTTAATVATAGPAGASTTVTHATVASSTLHPAGGVTQDVSQAAQAATRAYWTSSRMAAAAVAAGVDELKASPAAGPPPGTPTATHFNGVPTVGALFSTTGTHAHFCTASVVDSLTANLVITAAHCVYGGSFAKNIEFVPGYNNRLQPYGAWAVKTITVAAGWKKSQDPNLDFAFLAVAPPAGTALPIQLVTGGLRLGIDTGYAHPVEVIGYNDTGQLPIKCATTSFKFEPSQMEYFCRDYWNGTSGGPWITGYDGHDGSGTVIGVIGGFEQGGDFRWASYSTYFGLPTLKLFLQAQFRQAR